MFPKIVIFLLTISMELYATVKIMPMGDSITYDNGYADVKNPRPEGERSAYRNYLWYQLSDAGYVVDFVGSRRAGQSIVPAFDPDNEGYPGWTSYDLAEGTYAWLQQSSPDVILLHAGSMDQQTSPAGIEMILNEVDTYEANSGQSVTVILALIINRRSYAEWVTVLNSKVKAMASARIQNGDKIVIVDMENGAGIDYIKDMADPAHPTDEGYAKIATVWYNALTNLPIMQRETQEFVLRFYKYILEREADAAGLEYWAEELRHSTATYVAIGFFRSEEYKAMDLNSEEFIHILYHTMFDREAEAAGLTYWMDKLNSGTQRVDIMASFFNSQEFKDLAESFGIVAISDADREWLRTHSLGD